MAISRMHNISLVKRMVVLYLIGPLLLFIVFCSFITWFVGREMNQELQLSIDSDLKRTINTIDETVGTLTMIAEQMAYGYVSTNLTSMLLEENPYEKSRLIGNISDEINVMSCTNTGIRLMGYYNREKQEFVFLANGAADTHVLPENNYLLNRYEFSFQGPHISYAKNYNDLVISVNKKVPAAEGIDAYVELTLDLNPMNSFLQESEFVIIGSDGHIVYSGIEEGKELLGERKEKGSLGDYFFTRAEGEDGYRVFILVPRKEYYQLFRKMLPAAFFAVLCFGAVFSVVVFLMMKNVVRPLHVFEEEICKIQQGDLENRSYQKTLIPEYDHLLDEVMIMKQRIQGLLEEREAAQRVQAKARVDQLLYKINPHFLMNSLDTIHWLAVAENTKEIDKVARALNKLLYYNLKVDRNTVRLEEEIQAVRQYVLLQQSRFTFQFAVDIQDEKALQAKIPRFILQPLVENAIYHGLRENGHLVLMADVEEKLNIYVKDDGEGMEPQMLDELQEEARRGKKEGNKLGIGLNYVIQILREQFEENVTIQVMSRKQEGTIIHIAMPFEE